MIVCKIEVWPHGVKESAREIGCVVIANDGSGNHEFGNYDCALAHAGVHARKPGAWKGGRVERWFKKQSPYHLLKLAIEACTFGRKTKESEHLIALMRNGGSLPLIKEVLTAVKTDNNAPMSGGMVQRPSR